MVVNFSDEYAFCIGEIGLSKQEYWDLTPAETFTKVKGYLYNRDRDSANFRELFYLQYHQYVTKQSDRRTRKQLWPLSIDSEGQKQKNTDDLYERNKKIIEQMTKS